MGHSQSRLYCIFRVRMGYAWLVHRPQPCPSGAQGCVRIGGWFLHRQVACPSASRLGKIGGIDRHRVVVSWCPCLRFLGRGPSFGWQHGQPKRRSLSVSIESAPPRTGANDPSLGLKVRKRRTSGLSRTPHVFCKIAERAIHLAVIVSNIALSRSRFGKASNLEMEIGVAYRIAERLPCREKTVGFNPARPLLFLSFTLCMPRHGSMPYAAALGRLCSHSSI